ncbi:cytochrome b [Pseudonocardia spinosispora]|uniref:cytochrome b n=1 Tax=Pseudonocardia spinosispora TaxID=103441 RepID=UPI0003F89B32|nr:cytochrome b [Pseudonocardia spinosispora]
MTAEQPQHFTRTAQTLHWLMAVMVLAMLVVGVTMVTTTAGYHVLLAIHRPLGVAILVLVVVRFGYRLWRRPPPHPRQMHPLDRRAAIVTEYLLYALLLVQPLVGWATVSASGTPVVLAGSVHLPSIAPSVPSLYAALHQTHVVLAYALFLVFLGHLSGALVHALVLRDGVFERMVLGRRRVPASAVRTVEESAIRHR